MMITSAVLIVSGVLFVVVAMIGFANAYLEGSKRGKRFAIIFGLIAIVMILSGAILYDVVDGVECPCQDLMEEK